MAQSDPPHPPNQPPVVLMPRPAAINGIPEGLEYLVLIDQLLVHQQVNIVEILTSWEMNNRYQVKNILGQQVYFVAEETNYCMQQCCGDQRSFVMHVLDNYGLEVMSLQRPFKCCACCECCACSDCGANELTVTARSGQLMGSIIQRCDIARPRFSILDASGSEVLRIKGPACFCQDVCCTDDIIFPIVTLDGKKIGHVGKQYGGYCKELLTTATNFVLNFPLDLDVTVKAILLSSIFLIDFMYFEYKQDANGGFTMNTNLLLFN